MSDPYVYVVFVGPNTTLQYPTPGRALPEDLLTEGRGAMRREAGE